MKYCKKCFRNSADDNMVCPFCGNTNLVDYNVGDNFECSRTEPKFNEKNSKKDDVYNPYKDERLDSVFDILDDMSQKDTVSEEKKDFCVCLEDEPKEESADYIEDSSIEVQVPDTRYESLEEMRNIENNKNDNPISKKWFVVLGVVLLFFNPIVGIIYWVVVVKGMSANAKK